MPFNVRLGSLADCAAIQALNSRSNPHPWSDALIEESLTSRVCWVVEEEFSTQLVGWLVSSSIADQSELELVLVDNAVRRCGIAGKLMESWFRWAKIASVGELMLEVRESNQAAINMYYKLGFEEVGRRKNYYSAESGKEAAILMSLFLN